MVDPLPAEVVLCLPPWIAAFLAERGQAPAAPMTDPEARMRLVIEMSRRNALEGGGPFAAAVFDMDTQRLVAPGVNRVVALQCSSAHAEVLALSLAQRRLGTHTLAGGRYELVSSTEPCVMCFGAARWAGISRLLCGASGADATAIGFDEGPKVSDWVDDLQRLGIEVRRDLLRAEAATVLREYRGHGGRIYNAREG